MSEEEKKAIEILSIKATTRSIEAISYPNAIVMKKDIKTVLNLIDKQQEEIEELKEKQDYARLEKEQLLEDSISKDKIRNLLKQVNASLYHFKDSEKNNIVQRIKDRLE